MFTNPLPSHPMPHGWYPSVEAIGKGQDLSLTPGCLPKQHLSFEFSTSVIIRLPSHPEIITTDSEPTMWSGAVNWGKDNVETSRVDSGR